MVLPSGEKSNRCDDDIENGGASKSPGVTSRGTFAEMGVTKMCVRLPCRQSFQWRNKRLSMICALTPEASRSSARFFCAASSDRSGQTSLVKAIDWPSGDQMWLSASVESDVTCRASPPLTVKTHTCCEPLREDKNAIDFPSG